MADETSTPSPSQPSLPLPSPATPSESKDHLAPAERAYFETRGEAPIPAPASTPSQDEPAQVDSPAAAAPAPAEPSQTAPDDPAKNHQIALAEERQRRRDAEERARKLELNQARLDERFRMWEAAQQQQQRPPQEPPSPDRDIFGAVHHVMQKQAEIEQGLNATRQQQAQRDAIAQLEQWGAQQGAQFTSQAPDYGQALTHLRQSRANELRAFGLNNEGIGQQLLQEERQLLAYARQQNRNPAQMAYEFAQQRGYQPRKGGAAPGGAAAQQLDRIQAGQQASRSLSGVGGNAGGGNQVGVEDLLKMPMKEFAAWKEKNPAKFRKLKGA